MIGVACFGEHKTPCWIMLWFLIQSSEGKPSTAFGNIQTSRYTHKLSLTTLLLIRKRSLLASSWKWELQQKGETKHYPQAFLQTVLFPSAHCCGRKPFSKGTYQEARWPWVTAGKQITKRQVSMMKDYWEIKLINKISVGSSEKDQNGFRTSIIQAATLVFFYNMDICS